MIGNVFSINGRYFFGIFLFFFVSWICFVFLIFLCLLFMISWKIFLFVLNIRVGKCGMLRGECCFEWNVFNFDECFIIFDFMERIFNLFLILRMFL